MERVKIFYVVNNVTHLEEEINKWLKGMGDKIEITRTMQGTCGRIDNHVTITIFYLCKAEK